MEKIQVRRQLSLGKNIVISFVFLLISFISLLTIILSNSLLTQASTLSPDLNVNIGSAVSLLLTNCDGSNSSLLKLSIEPTPTGTFKSACQETSIHANTPGYSLTVRASGTNANYNEGNPTNNLLYLNPIDITNFTNGLPTINSTSNTIASPSVLTNNTWGFAVEELNSTDTPSNEATTNPNFDTTYTANNPNNNYASLPTTDTTIYNTTTWPLPTTEHTFYYATRVDTNTTAGTYGTTITYTAIGEAPVPAPTTCKNSGKYPECIAFTVIAPDGTYSIPTSGRVANMDHTYDWDVYVDGYLTDICTNGNCTGTSGTALPGAAGIVLSGLSYDYHQILIVPHSDPIPGWGNAFGYYTNTTAGTANTALNKNKLFSLDSSLTTMAFAPKTTESTTSASYMFANLFYGCSNLASSATFIDNYKLPSTITNLSYFMSNIHNSANSRIQSPMDLTPLANMLNANNTITNFSNFLASAHSRNSALQFVIDLSPVKDWFNANNSITDLSSFLSTTYSTITGLRAPTDLSPLKNWFNSNSSIRNLSYFLYHHQNGNHSLETPLDLSPITNWFNANNSITNLAQFLTATHYFNTTIKTPIDLSPIANWFNANTSITSISSFLNDTHYSNYALTSPLDISPLENWFNNNTTISNFNSFLSGTHYRNAQLTSPIDLTPLSNWFASSRKIATITSGVMYRTYFNISNITLQGQVIFPNWMKTITNGDDTLIWDIGTDCGDGTGSTQRCSFYQTFYTENVKANDITEPKFMDGTVLSSVGQPSGSHETYNGRSAIIPLNNTNGHWKSD